MSRRNNGHWRMRASLAVVVAVLGALAGTASASLQLLQPNPAVPATFIGHAGYSADGLGQFGAGGSVQAEVPAGSHVELAYLYGTYYLNSDPTLANRTINFDGTNVVLTKLPHSQPGGGGFATARTDVTGQVAAKVGGGGGVFNFVIGNDPAGLDGVALVVIFTNPALPITTIAVLDGGAVQTGDTTTFNFTTPIDKTVPGFGAIMSVGSGFSYQGQAGHVCGTQAPQSSLIDVNGSRLTSCAGNYDDGASGNGALITVGGVGDSTNNPANPLQQPADGTQPRVDDDELYDIASFVAQGATSVTIKTSNPSSDDNLFLVIISITGEAAVNPGVGCPTVTPGPGDIVGTAGPDKLLGTPGNDRIFGLGGNDWIDGGGGDDVILGGDGDDKLFGGDGADTLCGENGTDYLAGGNGKDKLFGGPGNDDLSGDAGDDTLNGEVGTDRLNGGAGTNVLSGGGNAGDQCVNPPTTVSACPA